MSPFDDDLRSSLRRKEPSPDFAQRVLARIQAAEKPKASWLEGLVFALRHRRLPRTAMAAAALALVFFAGVRYRRQERLKAEGEVAKERLLVALRIAGTKLNFALKEAQRINGPAPDRARDKSTKRTEPL